MLLLRLIFLVKTVICLICQFNTVVNELFTIGMQFDRIGLSGM
jgi:hypothetical protein